MQKDLRRVQMPHRQLNFSKYKNEEICSDCVKNPKMNCFIPGVARACDLCSGKMSQKKVYTTQINNLKRQPPNEYSQTIPNYITSGESIRPENNNFNFEIANVSMFEDRKMVEIGESKEVQRLLNDALIEKWKTSPIKKKYM